MPEPPRIRPAGFAEAERISALAMRSKAYWGYSAEFMAACRAELTVDADRIGSAEFHYEVAESDGRLLGFYAIEKRSRHEFELEALFVEPGHMGRGIGRALLDHAAATVATRGGCRLLIQGDPHADGFYRAAGGKLVGWRESASIDGRKLPLYLIDLDPARPPSRPADRSR